ncbi:MAG: tetratricopeptide repeat protein [Desulfovibrionaceae bacterium]
MVAAMVRFRFILAACCCVVAMVAMVWCVPTPAWPDGGAGDKAAAPVKVVRIDKRRAEALRRQGFHLQRMGNYTKAIAKYRESLKYDPSPNIVEHVARLEAMARAAGQRLPGEPKPDPKAYVPKPRPQTPYETFPGAHMHPSVPPMSASLGYPEDKGNPSGKGLGAMHQANATVGTNKRTGADAMARLYKYEGLELLHQRRYIEAQQSLAVSLEYAYDPVVEDKLALVVAKIREMNALAAVRQRVRAAASTRKTPVSFAVDKAAAGAGQNGAAQPGDAARAQMQLESQAGFRDLDGRSQSIEVVDCVLTIRSANTGSPHGVVELFPLQRVDRIEYWPGSPFNVDLYAAEAVVRRVFLQKGAYVSDMETDTAVLTATADVSNALLTLVEACGGHPSVAAAR